MSHAGLVWLGEVADRSGLTGGLCTAVADLPRRRHDPGATLAQMVVALADGAQCVSDFAVVHDQPALFGPAASRPTAWRAIDGLGPQNYRRIAAARAQARAAAWAAGAGPAGGEGTIDLDATIIRTRADKENAAPTYKRTYGHHPLLAMIAETGEMLTGMFRAGNAGANNAADHVVVLGAAIDQLPAQWRAGHLPGDPADWVSHKLLVRGDAAAASHWLTEACVDRNLEFSFGYQIDHRIRDALMLFQEEDWQPAVEPGGKPRDGAQIAELTHLVNLDTWPHRTRLIVRRERPHPGAQLTLFDTIEGLRHTAFITNTTGPDIAALELRHRQRGRAEQTIRDLKACGLGRFPFDAARHNDAWMHLCFAATDLLA